MSYVEKTRFIQSDLRLLLLSLYLISGISTVALGRANYIALPRLSTNLRDKLVHVGGIHGGDVATTHAIGKERFE